MKGFTIYKEYYELISLLSEKDQQELLLAIVKYMFDGTIPTLNEKQMKIFVNLKRPLDKSKKRSKAGASITSNDNQDENKHKSNENQNEIKTRTQQVVNVNVNSNISNNSKLTINSKLNNSGSSKKEDNNINNINSNKNINNIDNLYSYIESNYGRTLSPLEVEKINLWSEEFNVDMLEYAIQISVLNRKQKFQYVEGILRNWKSQGYKSVQEVKENEEKIKTRTHPESNSNVEIFDYDWIEDLENEND